MADTSLSAQIEHDYKVSKWSRNTVADGSWLQKYTVERLTNRDIALANAIDTAITSKLNDEITARIAGDEYLSAAITSVSSDLYSFSAKVENSAENIVNTIKTFSANVESSASDLNYKIDNETNRAINKETLLENKIKTLEAATDVIMVYGTYDDFTSKSAKLWEESAGYLTENDVIKILVDNSKGSANQTYYQATNVNYYTSSCTWTEIGALDPYYSREYIDEYFETFSSTVSNNYLSANKQAVVPGKNIVVTEKTGPVIEIKTSANVEFDKINDTSVNSLINSAKSGYAASAYITAHSGDFLNSAHSAYGKLTFGTKEYPATNSSYNFTFSAGKGIGFTTGNNQVTISAEGTTARLPLPDEVISTLT